MSAKSHGPGSAEDLRQMTLTQSYTLGRPSNFRFSADSSTLFYLRSAPEHAAAKLWALDVATQSERLLIDPEELSEAKALSPEEKARRERLRIRTGGLSRYFLLAGSRFVLAPFAGKLWLHDIEKNRTRPLDMGDLQPHALRPSPDGSRLAFVSKHNLYVARLDLKASDKQWKKKSLAIKVTRLTDDGSPTRQHGLPEFVAQEEMGRFHGAWWSPDGRWLAYQTTETSNVDRFTLFDPSRPDRAPRRVPYPRAGRPNAKVSLHVVRARGAKKRQIEWDSEKFEYLARVLWSKNAPLSLLVQTRDQKTQQFLRADERTGATRVMFEESDAAWLNLTDSTPRWAPDGRSYFWATEESGAWTLEQHHPRLGEKKDGLRKRETVLQAQQGFSRLLRIDAQTGALWFLGSTDPVEEHLYRKLPDGPTERFNSTVGEHSAVIAPDGQHLTLSRKVIDGWCDCELVHTEDPARRSPIPHQALAPPAAPAVQRLAPEQAGGFHAFILRPHEPPQAKLPVILYVYGGPHHRVVRADAARYLLPQWLADQGFIVVGLDGRGTPGRGRDFERAIEKRLAEVPLEDQVKGLQAILQQVPEADPERVGVYGWSFGGYMAALAVMDRPDMFKAAVAGAPVTDWAWYDTHYTERYMGHPDVDGEAYQAASLLPRAAKLQRPLLLIHGLVDDNVYLTHSLQLGDALFAAKKDFQLLPLPGLTHQIASPEAREALYTRIVRFFQTEL